MLKKLYITLEKLEDCKEFGKFKKENPLSFLASAFFMVEEKGLTDANWQVDFYSPEKHRISSFTLVSNSVEVKADQQVFQQDKKALEQLNLDNVKVDFEDVQKMIDDIRDEHYKGESANKIIVLLQNIQEIGVWNITYLTNSFKVWNLKFNANSGSLISEKMESILSFKSQ